MPETRPSFQEWNPGTGPTFATSRWHQQGTGSKVNRT